MTIRQLKKVLRAPVARYHLGPTTGGCQCGTADMANHESGSADRITGITSRKPTLNISARATPLVAAWAPVRGPAAALTGVGKGTVLGDSGETKRGSASVVRR